MTITTTQSSVTYSGNAATTVFGFPFLIPTATELSVYIIVGGVTTFLTSNQYTATGFGNPSGGNITYNPGTGPLPIGATITLYRTLPVVQESSLVNQGGFYPQVIESALDYLTMLIQQLETQINNSVIANAIITQNVLQLDPIPNIAAMRALTAAYALNAVFVNTLRGGYFYANAADTSTGWTGTGFISGNTFHVVTSTSGAIKVGQQVANGGYAPAWIISGSGGTWTVSGPSQTSLGTQAMTADEGGMIFVTLAGTRMYRSWQGPIANIFYTGDDGVGADNTYSHQSWFYYLEGTGAPTTQHTGYWVGGEYTISAGLVFNTGTSGAQLPYMITDGPQNVILTNSGAITNSPMIEFTGGSSAAQLKSRWNGILLNGASAAGVEGVRSNGVGYFTLDGWVFEDMPIGARGYAANGSVFVEGFICENCDFTVGITEAWMQFSVGSGASSFRGSGLRNCTGHINNSSALLVDAGAHPYFTEINFTCWIESGTSATSIIQNNTTQEGPSFIGDVSVESFVTNGAVVTLFGGTGLGTWNGTFQVYGQQAGTNNFQIGKIARVDDAVVESNGAVIQGGKLQSYTHTTTTTGETVSLAGNATGFGAANGYLMSIQLAASNWEYNQLHHVINFSGTTVDTIVSNPSPLNGTGWGVPVFASAGNGALTVTNVSWTAGVEIQWTILPMLNIQTVV